MGNFSNKRISAVMQTGSPRAEQKQGRKGGCFLLLARCGSQVPITESGTGALSWGWVAEIKELPPEVLEKL